MKKRDKNSVIRKCAYREIHRNFCMRIQGLGNEKRILRYPRSLLGPYMPTLKYFLAVSKKRENQELKSVTISRSSQYDWTILQEFNLEASCRNAKINFSKYNIF